MKDALAIHRMLLERETLHEIVRLPRMIANADELPEALGLPADHCLSTRVFSTTDPAPQGFESARGLAAVIVRSGAAPSPDAVRKALGAQRARPASPAAINAATEYAADLVTPLLLPEPMPVLVDQRVVDSLGVDDVVYTATGEPGTALGIRCLDLLALAGAKPADLVGRRRTREARIEHRPDSEARIH